MSQPVPLLGPDDELSLAATKLKSSGFGLLPVVSSDGRFLGTLSSSDLFDKNNLHLPTVVEVVKLLEIVHPHDIEKFSEKLKVLRRLKVRSIMNDAPIYLVADATVTQAIEALIHHNTTVLPVVDNLTSKKVIGVLSQSDILKMLGGTKSAAVPGRGFTGELQDMDVLQELKDNFVLVSRTRERFWFLALIVFLMLGILISIGAIIRVRIF